MSKRALFILVLGVPSVALAQPGGDAPPVGPPVAPVEPPVAPPVVAPPVMPVAPVVVPAEPKGGPPENGFQIQARLTSGIGVSSIISPGFSMGYRMGSLVIGGELGITAGKLETDTETDSFSLVTLMPMIYIDIWQSADRRARLNLVGGIGVGQGKVTSTSGGTTTESKASFVPLLAAIGGDYYLHKNFALGVEAGLELPVLTKVEDNGTDQNLKGGFQSLHGMFRVTFVTGR
jgi:hypothetical protein